MVKLFVQNYKVVKSDWPNEEGECYYTITDGVEERGKFSTKEEAIKNMERIIANWRRDS
jgi:hypothetical protein